METDSQKERCIRPAEKAPVSPPDRQGLPQPSGVRLSRGQEELSDESSLPQGTLPMEGNWDRYYQCGQMGHFRRECPYMDFNYGQVLTVDQ